VADRTETHGVVHPDRGDGPGYVARRRAGYLAFAAALTAVVGSAIVDGASEIDVWGVSSDRVTASGGGYDLEVTYPTVSRPALATPFAIVVHSDEGFSGEIDIALDPAWWEMWDYQALNPEPTASTGEPGRLVLTFDTPDGEDLRIFFDGRIQPAQQSGRSGWVAVLDGRGNVAVQVDFETAVRP
jgi:hypothetical protein